MWVNNIGKRMSVFSSVRSNIMKQNNLVMQGRIPSAAFAKYDRAKPHLNVGTIGKCIFINEVRPKRRSREQSLLGSPFLLFSLNIKY